MHGNLRKMSSLTSYRTGSRKGAKKIFGFLKRLVLRGVSLLASGCPTEVPAPSTVKHRGRVSGNLEPAHTGLREQVVKFQHKRAKVGGNTYLKH